MEHRVSFPSGFGRRARVAIGVGLVVITAATLVLRLPQTISQLNSTAKTNKSYTALGRTLALADLLDIDNGFVVGVTTYLPPGASFGLLTPDAQTAAREHIPAETTFALVGYLQYLLLPRREVAPADASYLVCYACADAKSRARVHIVWSQPGGYWLGRVRSVK